MEEKWGEKHFNALKEAGYSERNSKLGKGGYPDCGSGLYSQGLSYKQWFDFNTAQRVHKNSLELYVQAIVFGLVAGLRFPIAIAVILGIYMIARLGYVVAY